MSDEQSENGKTGHPKRSLYCVFYALGSYESEDEALSAAAWSACGTYEVTDNMGQRSARKQALAANDDLRHRIENGEDVWFLCVPRRSLHPFRSAMKVAEPRLVI